MYVVDLLFYSELFRRILPPISVYVKVIFIQYVVLWYGILQLLLTNTCLLSVIILWSFYFFFITACNFKGWKFTDCPWLNNWCTEFLPKWENDETYSIFHCKLLLFSLMALTIKVNQVWRTLLLSYQSTLRPSLSIDTRICTYVSFISLEWYFFREWISPFIKIYLLYICYHRLPTPQKWHII